MQVPLQITFRHMDPSPALEARIRRRAEELEQFSGRITACHVTVESRHRRHHKCTTRTRMLTSLSAMPSTRCAAASRIMSAIAEAR